MRKAVIISALLLAATTAQAQEPIDLTRALVRVANPGALMMPGMAMPSGFPNNYTSTPSFSFDPNTGSQGTLFLSYNFTGLMTPGSGPMCTSGAKHFPHVGIVVYHGNTPNPTVYSAGQQVAPCVNMNQTLTVALDLGADGCDLAMLDDGECSLTEQTDGVFCTFMLADFAILFNTWQFEGATSETQTVRAAPPYPQSPWCGDESDPPDFFIKTATGNGTGYFVATAHLIRFQRRGSSFNGVPWLKVSFIGVFTPVPAGPKPVCTEYDKGCRWGAAFCTGQPNGPETRLIPKPVINRYYFLGLELAQTVTAIK